MRPAGQLRVNNGEAVMPALLAGLGIADLPEFIVGDAVASGEVEVILKGWKQPEGAVHLVTPPGGPRPARVEVLAEFLAKQFAKGKGSRVRSEARPRRKSGSRAAPRMPHRSRSIGTLARSPRYRHQNEDRPGRRLPMNRRELLQAPPRCRWHRPRLPTHAFAQAAYPTRNITMIVPFPAGGQADLAARPVALALERILGKPVIVDNRAGGAGGSIGNAQAARAEPDGYTLLMTLSSLAVLPEADRLFDRPVAYEVSQFAPIARVLADPTLLAVPASAPWKTLKDFVDDAKKRPGQIPYGSSGPYGTLHVAMEMFAASAGIKLLHVPFRGAGPALTALLSGTVQALASAPGTLKQQVEDGKMRVLANWGAERIASFPDLPTFRELGYKDVEFYIWAGLFAQSALPAPIMTRLREAMAQAVKAPEVIKTFETAGSPVAYLDAPEFSKFVADDSARLIAAVKKIGKVE